MVLEHIRSDECIEERGYLESRRRYLLAYVFLMRTKSKKGAVDSFFSLPLSLLLSVSQSLL